MRTIIALTMGLMLVLAGCSDKKAESELQKRNEELSSQLAAKDQFIDEVTSSISEIHERLEGVVAKEKNVMRQASSGEGKKAMTPAELKQAALDRIADISSLLDKNRKRVAQLQSRLNASATKYDGLQKMVDDLKTQLDQREQSVADLQTRIQNLEGEVTQKTQIIAARDAMIADQRSMINTSYYVVGKKKELKEKGIVEDEGGFLWGLLGSTTVLTANFDEDQFETMDKTKEMTIEVPGVIDEMIPHRDASTYSAELQADGHTVLKITKPGDFWRQSHLVIITE